MKELIDKLVIDSNGKECLVTDATSNSAEVFLKKTSIKGIDCKQWFSKSDFEKRFKVKP